MVELKFITRTTFALLKIAAYFEFFIVWQLELEGYKRIFKRKEIRFSLRGFTNKYGRTSFIGSGPGSSVGIATDYGLDGSGIEFRWGRDFPPVQTGPGVHPASCKRGTGSFPGVKCGRSVLLTTHHF